MLNFKVFAYERNITSMMANLFWLIFTFQNKYRLGLWLGMPVFHIKVLWFCICSSLFPASSLLLIQSGISVNDSSGWDCHPHWRDLGWVHSSWTQPNPIRSLWTFRMNQQMDALSIYMCISVSAPPQRIPQVAFKKRISPLIFSAFEFYLF